MAGPVASLSHPKNDGNAVFETEHTSNQFSEDSNAVSEPGEKHAAEVVEETLDDGPRLESKQTAGVGVTLPNSMLTANTLGDLISDEQPGVRSADLHKWLLAEAESPNLMQPSKECRTLEKPLTLTHKAHSSSSKSAASGSSAGRHFHGVSDDDLAHVDQAGAWIDPTEDWDVSWREDTPTQSIFGSGGSADDATSSYIDLDGQPTIDGSTQIVLSAEAVQLPSIVDRLLEMNLSSKPHFGYPALSSRHSATAPRTASEIDSAFRATASTRSTCGPEQAHDTGGDAAPATEASSADGIRAAGQDVLARSTGPCGASECQPEDPTTRPKGEGASGRGKQPRESGRKAGGGEGSRRRLTPGGGRGGGGQGNGGGGGSGGARRDGDDGDQEPQDDPRTGSEPASPANFKLACPFFKRHHERYLWDTSCSGKWWPTVARLKEHIYRVHLGQFYCPRCDSSFPDLASRDDHLRLDPLCAVSASRVPRDELTSHQFARLHSKSYGNRGSTEPDKWRYVFMILFPTHDPNSIPSPYFEPPGELSRFRQHVELRAFTSSVRNRLLQRVVEIQVLSPSDQVTQLLQLVGDMQLQTIDDFQSPFSQLAADTEAQAQAAQSDPVGGALMESHLAMDFQDSFEAPPPAGLDATMTHASENEVLYYGHGAHAGGGEGVLSLNQEEIARLAQGQGQGHRQEQVGHGVAHQDPYVGYMGDEYL